VNERDVNGLERRSFRRPHGIGSDGIGMEWIGGEWLIFQASTKDRRVKEGM
jgi:hypothetical protein